jgi:hypothetical protein
MKALRTLLVFVAASIAATLSHAATTTTAVDIPAADGGTQRFLQVRPDAPIAYIVQFPGGTGILNIQSDGSMGGPVAECNPIGRNAAAFADRRIGLALIDQTTMGSIYNWENLVAVARKVRERDDVPVWITGGSASTGSVGLAAIMAPADIPAGVFFYSPVRPATNVANIRRPAVVIYHPNDPEQFGNAMYNALASAPVRERIAITGGSGAGCGFHLFNGADAEFVNAAAGFIERNNAATSTAPLNVQGLWFKSPAFTESGWGVNLTQQGGILFATWFTYDTDGRGLWLVMPSGARSGNSWSGALYRTTGPAFSSVPFNPAQVVATEVGTATFAFADADNGTFSYVVGGVSQSKAITRQVFSTLPTCSEGGAHGASPNYQALWWSDPPNSESGWGLNIAHQGDILFATWFTYDTDGRGMWLVLPNGARTGPGAYSGALYRTTGTPLANAWVNSALVATEVGSASLVFADANRGTFTYTLGGVTQAKPITRQVYREPATVCR